MRSTSFRRSDPTLTSLAFADLQRLFNFDGFAGIDLTESIPDAVIKWLTYVLILHPIGKGETHRQVLTADRCRPCSCRVVGYFGFAGPFCPYPRLLGDLSHYDVRLPRRHRFSVGIRFRLRPIHSRKETHRVGRCPWISRTWQCALDDSSGCHFARRLGLLLRGGPQVLIFNKAST